MTRRISVSDVTMTRQGNGSITFREKIELAKLLDKLGISAIETTPILNGKSDILLVKSLSSAIKESTLAVPVDIFDPKSAELTWSALAEAISPRLQVSVPVSTVQMEYICHLKPSAILQLIAERTKQCATLCPDVEFIACDFGRAETEFLLKAIETATGAGATTVTVCDMAGNLLPQEFHDNVKKVRDILPDGIRLGVLCSNEMYMADACAISAVQAGADEIKVTPFDNSITSLKRFTQILNTKSDTCGAICNVKTTEIKRVTSQIKRIFAAHKAGNGLSDSIGEDSSAMNLTIHDSREDVLKVAAKLGYELSQEDADNVYETFVRLASKNEIVEPKELDAIIASAAFQVPPTYRLQSYVINTGNTISATCHIRIIKGEEQLENVCVGDGPVDAAFQAIDKVVGKHYELDDFQIQSVTEGREAMGEAVVRLRNNGKVYSGRGISTDIVGSSVMAYLNAVNKIAYEEEEA